MTLSKYDQALKELREKRCETCHGSGQCDDLELGDIFGNYWQCTDCGGTGFKQKDRKCKRER